MIDLLKAHMELFIIVGILLLNGLLKVAFIRRIKKKEVKDLLTSIVNWISIFSVLGLLFAYFSETNDPTTTTDPTTTIWLFKTLTTINNSAISLFTIGLALFIIILAVKMVAITKKHILPKAYSKYDIGLGTQFTFNRLFQYITIVIAVLIALNTIGINISSLMVFAGAIGVGIGFGLQNLASNFISGLVILFERPIQVGERVIIDDIVGDVDEIKLRATVVKTLDNERIIIPNSFFLEEKFVNRSYSDTRLRLVINVGVSYGSDVRLVEQLLLQSVDSIHESWDEILSTPAPCVHFVGFGDSSLDFILYVWINHPSKEYQIKSDLHFMILEKFRTHGVEIPFPQQDVHIKNQS